MRMVDEAMTQCPIGSKREQHHARQTMVTLCETSKMSPRMLGCRLA
jgi:hypothetical protein